jgi:hypothetical protein
MKSYSVILVLLSASALQASTEKLSVQIVDWQDNETDRLGR